MTPLDKTLRRALAIKGVDYVISISPEGLKITGKGRRLGLELAWLDLISGQTALAMALQASVGRISPPEPAKNTGRESTPRKKTARKKTQKNRRARGA